MLRTYAERDAYLKRVPNVEASGGRTVSPAGCLKAVQFVQFYFYLDTWKDACGRCSRLLQNKVLRPSACSKLAHRDPQLFRARGPHEQWWPWRWRHPFNAKRRDGYRI